MALDQGRVEVVAGPMFAGKTEELLRRVRRAVIAGRRVQVFSHSLDVRRGTRSSGRSGRTASWSPSTRPTSSGPD